MRGYKRPILYSITLLCLSLLLVGAILDIVLRYYIFEKEIKKIVAENKDAPFNALIGKVMGVLRGKADSKKIIEMLNKMK